MKLVLEEREIQSNMSGKEIGFSINANQSFIFEFLRKGIYAHPVTSTVRELLSNAIDSHRKAGKTGKPVQIILNRNSIAFRDFGTGMSPETIEEVYAVYGNSTKRDSDVEIGAFGMGAKSFFSIVDTATIETVYNCMKYIYAAYIDASNIGKIKLISEEPTDETNGTTIKLPVGDHYYSLQTEVSFYSSWTDFPIDLPGEYRVEKPQPIIKGSCWAIYKNNRCNIIADCIPYTDSHYDIPSGLVIKLKNGTYDLNGSRESLRYTPRTDKAVADALAVFDKEIAQQTQQVLDKVNTFQEVIKIIEGIPCYSKDNREWTWKGQSFKYPLHPGMLTYERTRKKLAVSTHNVFGGSFTEDRIITLDKDEVSTYDRQRIGTYLTAKQLNRVYLVPPGTFPVNAPNLTSIKVVRQPGQKRGIKETIKAKGFRDRRVSDFIIDRTDKSVVIYTTKDINSYRSIYHLGANLVQIAEKDEKYIEDEENWITLDEFIQQEVYDKLTVEEIQAIANAQQAVSTYQNLAFLGDHHSDFEFLKRDSKDWCFKNKYNQKTLELISFLVDNHLVQPVVPDLYKKYSMLGLIRYISESEKQAVIDYVNLVNTGEAGGAN